jgi:hypothetical protein
VAEDDNEKDTADDLPPKVKQALDEARQSSRTDKAKRNDGRWLALIPALAAALLFPLMMPRATVPRDIPVPYLDGDALRAVIRADRSRAATARDPAHRLPTHILAVGSALRAFNLAQASATTGLAVDERTTSSRVVMDDALRTALGRPDATEDLVALRALQTDEFIEQVAAYEASGKESNELVEIAGAFVRHMHEAGWIDGQRIILDDAQRRVAYKLVWNAIVGVGQSPKFAPTLDEERALYTLYLEHPHPADIQRAALESERIAAATPAECLRATLNYQRASEVWRIEKIRTFGSKDPSYPTSYALGVAFYRAGRLESSIDAFRDYLQHHPDGAFALRARNHLKAAVEANGAI